MLAQINDTHNEIPTFLLLDGVHFINAGDIV